MGIFKKRKTLTIPDECVGMQVRIESSTCTGEKTIGFYDNVSKKLMYKELVKTQDDIDDFYEKYGIEKTEQ